MTCTFCGHRNVVFHDFGEVALAGGFLKPKDFSEEKKYPLKLAYCPECHAVEVVDKIDPDIMFKDYFYFSSASETTRNYFRGYALEMVNRFKPKCVIEIGCNDGVFINPIRDFGALAIGVDPSNTVPKGNHIINDYFTQKVVEDHRIDGWADLIVANNVMAHIVDIHDTTKAINLALRDDGVFVMEAHYLGDMIDKLQYDWIYHEHIYYYSLLAIENHFANYGMRVFDVKPSTLHGGSMRYYICKDKRGREGSVYALRKKEENRLDSIEAFIRFSIRVKLHIQKLKEELSGRIVGYGASGRANSLIQFADLDIEYIVDDAPAKHGFYTPGSHVPIVDKLGDADKVLVFAWTYLEEISKKVDIPMVVPFPEIKTIEPI